MKRILSIIFASLISAQGPLFAAADEMDFYKQEAEVVSASLRPQSAKETPATVYVITQQDIKDSGATTFWDILRKVPGVDVTQFRTGQGEIGIRGLNQSFNNRVLVLIDGRSALDGYFDRIMWESLPITMDEIDRIEVVEGPVSAVYGPNATSGVINIITKSPERIQGGQVSGVGGERNTYQGSALYGRKDGPVGYRFNGGYRTANRFEDASEWANESGLFNGLVNYDLSDHAGVSVSGGLNHYRIINSLAPFGLVEDKGTASYARTDAHYKDTHLRAYWNRGRTKPESLFSTDPVDFDQYDMQVDQSVNLPFKNQVAFGATYHNNSATTLALNQGKSVHQDIWSGFFEDKWEPADRWLLMMSGRVDKHPLTPLHFSPRGSLLFTPVPEHAFRISAGTSYRNPTLLENYVDVSQAFPTGDPIFPVSINRVLGSTTLDPERLESVEIAHTGRFTRMKTNITGFWYRYKDFIDSIPVVTFPDVTSTFVNVHDPLTAVGGEAGAEYMLTSWLRIFGNYSYQYLHSPAGSDPTRANGSPRHKANTGLRTKNGGWTTNWEVNWVDKIMQNSQITADNTDPLYLQPVSAYFLVNAHVGYAFSGRLNGLEVGVNAFNLLNHDHFEALPPPSPVANGQSGEIIRGRFTGTVSYKF